MLVFPQLTTGAAALYPFRRGTERRTVVNRLADGRTVTYADTDWAARRWELEATGLSREELDAIEALYGAAKGPLHTFTFLEPAGNLLARSEEFGAPEWDNDPLINITAGIDDPFSGDGAMRIQNASGVAAGGLKQTLAVPGNFRYTLSAWVRGAGSGSSVTLTATTAGGSVSVPFTLSGAWRRVSIPVAMGQATESVTFGATVAAGDLVDVFGMQVESQLGASTYQKTGARGGVHSQARFAGPILTVRALGGDDYDAVIRVVSKGS